MPIFTHPDKGMPCQCARLFFLFVCLLFSHLAHASFYKKIWPIWEVHNPLSKKIISHQAWQNFLSRRVIANREGINLVDYPKIEQHDINELEQYLQHMAKININDYNRHEQLAFWLNVYNALTVHTIALHYPIESVSEINTSPGLFSVGPWSSHLITINHTQLSLDDILHRIIRPIWNDPRTHYAINNGSIGAANLSQRAFKGSVIDEQLNTAAFEYINALRGVQIIKGKLIASKLFVWFLDDFGGNEQNLIHHLRQFSNPSLKKVLKKIKSVNLYTYNWHLNGGPA